VSLDDPDGRVEHVTTRDHYLLPRRVDFADLDEWLIGDEDDLTDPNPGDLEHVERLLRGIAYREREIARARDFAQAVRDRVAEWLEQEEKRLSTDHHRLVLEGYHRARLAEDPRAKTITLPSGTLTARAGQARWSIDADYFVPWAQAHAPELVRTKVEPALSEAKRALTVDNGNAVTQDGEVVPGVLVEPGETKFTVKAGDQ
jgi:hypothetical protein